MTTSLQIFSRLSRKLLHSRRLTSNNASTGAPPCGNRLDAANGFRSKSSSIASLKRMRVQTHTRHSADYRFLYRLGRGLMRRTTGESDCGTPTIVKELFEKLLNFYSAQFKSQAESTTMCSGDRNQPDKWKASLQTTINAKTFVLLSLVRGYLYVNKNL